MSTTTKRSQSVDARILARLRRRGPGTVAAPSDFLDLGSRQAVDVALHRLVQQKKIRRLAHGLYDYPVEHPVLGTRWPTAERVAKALVGRDRVRLQPAGAYAANLLGLSEQVPGRVVYLTDGISRRVKVGPLEIQLRRTTPRNMAAAGRLSGLLIQALRHLGKEHVTPGLIARLKRALPLEERQAVLSDLALAPTWMHPIMRELAEE